LTSLKARGLIVAAFDPATIAETYSAVERLGILFGKEAEASALVNKTKDSLAKITERTKKAASRPTVAFEVRADPLTLAGKGGLVAEIIDIAGGKVCVDIDKKLVRFDMEALLKADPDAYIVQEGPMNKNPPRPEERPFQASLRAVREKRVLYVDEKLVSRPGPRIAEAAEMISRFLHPELWP
jgi:iron complex transport system substrate-binding protein